MRSEFPHPLESRSSIEKAIAFNEVNFVVYRSLYGKIENRVAIVEVVLRSNEYRIRSALED